MVSDILSLLYTCSCTFRWIDAGEGGGHARALMLHLYYKSVVPSPMSLGNTPNLHATSQNSSRLHPRPNHSPISLTNTPSDHILSRHVSLCSSTHLSIFMSFIFPTNSVRTRSKINANPAFAAFCLKWEEIKQSIKSCLISSAPSIALFSGSLFRSRFLWFNSFSDKRRPADEETLASATDLWMKRP